MLLGLLVGATSNPYKAKPLASIWSTNVIEEIQAKKLLKLLIGFTVQVG